MGRGAGFDVGLGAGLAVGVGLGFGAGFDWGLGDGLAVGVGLFPPPRLPVLRPVFAELRVERGVDWAIAGGL